MSGKMTVIASAVACLMLALVLGCSTDSAPPPPEGPTDYTVLGKKLPAEGRREYCVSFWLAGAQVEMCGLSHEMVYCWQNARIGSVLPGSCPRP